LFRGYSIGDTAKFMAQHASAIDHDFVQIMANPPQEANSIFEFLALFSRASRVNPPLARARSTDRLSQLRKTHRNVCRFCWTLKIPHVHTPSQCPCLAGDAAVTLFDRIFAKVIGDKCHVLAGHMRTIKPTPATLLIAALHLGRNSEGMTHGDEINARSRCLGVASILMADEGKLLEKAIEDLARLVMQALGWTFPGPATREVMAEEDSDGEPMYTDEEFIKRAKREKMASLKGATLNANQLTSRFMSSVNDRVCSDSTGASGGQGPTAIRSAHPPSIYQGTFRTHHIPRPRVTE
jgi:hypothetical protein